MARKVKPLTDLDIRRAKAGEVKRDGGGLYLVVKGPGEGLWRHDYRFGGKRLTNSFGRYPTVTLAMARDKRLKAERLLGEGTNPMEAKKRVSLTARIAASNTFGVVADELLAKLEREGKAAVTKDKARWLLDMARPALGDRPVAEITPPEVLEVLRQVENRNHLETAGRLRSIISRVCRLAVATGRAENDPTIALRGAIASPKPVSRAAITNPAGLGALLRAIADYRGQPEVVAALKLMAYLFPRPGELRMADWDEFDLEAAVWSIPATRMKMRRPHKVPLPTQAVAILKDLRAIAGRTKLVFPSVRSSQRCISENTLNAALRRMGFTQDQMTAHGFRAAAATLLNESGKWHADAIERQLAHIENNDVRRTYARGEHWDERVKMMTWWADHIDALRDGTKIIPLPSNKA